MPWGTYPVRSPWVWPVWARMMDGAVSARLHHGEGNSADVIEVPIQLTLSSSKEILSEWVWPKQVSPFKEELEVREILLRARKEQATKSSTDASSWILPTITWACKKTPHSVETAIPADTGGSETLSRGPSEAMPRLPTQGDDEIISVVLSH